MQESHLELLRCPVTRSHLRLHVISRTTRKYKTQEIAVIREAILFADEDWFYPVVDGIPRLLVESFADHALFFQQHLPDYDNRRQLLESKYPALIRYVLKKNNRTKRSFSLEWSLFDYEKTKTWDADQTGMLQRFLDETNETAESLRGKMILDAGCGNGKLDDLVAACGARIVAMDFSNSIERAYGQGTHESVFYIQGDVQFPPVAFGRFDIVHCSGVLICTNNTELSFSCLEPCVRIGGKYSVWLYQPRKEFIHRLINFVRRITSKWPLRLQYFLLRTTVFPVSYMVKRLKGNKQSKEEMMIDILDWFTPEFRWEHEQNEAASWFYKRNYSTVDVTTTTLFGYNITGIKKN